MKRIVLLLAAFGALLPAAPGAQELVLRRIRGRVLASDGLAVQIDRGAQDGLEPGDRVLLFPAGGRTLEGWVDSVADRSAWVRIREAGTPVEPGVRVEVEVPAGRLDRQEASPRPSSAPQHPPWSGPPDEWSAEQPLLAAARGRKPEDRTPVWSGRFYTSGDYSVDREAGENKFAFVRSGLDLRGTNLFGAGGVFHFDGEANYRQTTVPGLTDESAVRGRLDRLSYTWGGNRHEPTRIAAGRFLQDEFPEFGVLDGVEVAYRLPGGDRFGASAGFMPDTSALQHTGDDFQTALFYRMVFGEPERLSVAAGFQKTWHEWARDRDLLVTKLRWLPGSGFSFHGTAWVDFYGSGDVIKGSGSELTQFFATATWRGEGGDGIAATASQTRFPELLRFTVFTLPAADILRNKTQRLGVRGWTRVSEAVRLSARVDGWQDEDDSGGSGEIRADIRDLVVDGSNLALAVFTTQGQFVTLAGARADARVPTSAGTWTLGLQTAQVSYQGLLAGQDGMLQHSLRATWDRQMGRGWGVNAYLEERLGEGQDSMSLGFYLQKRF